MDEHPIDSYALLLGGYLPCRRAPLRIQDLLPVVDKRPIRWWTEQLHRYGWLRKHEAAYLEWRGEKINNWQANGPRSRIPNDVSQLIKTKQ